METLQILFPFWGVPALFLLSGLIIILVTKKLWIKRGLIYFFIAYALSFFLGFSGIGTDRSSTASLGYLTLPVISLIPAILACGLGISHYFYNLKKKNNETGKVALLLMIIFGILVLIPYYYQTQYWFKEIKQNKEFAENSKKQTLALEDNTLKLKVELKENPGKELGILESLANTTDRTQLIPIAKSKYASIELLDELSKSNDLGVVLTVVRNQNTSAETLERVFTSHSYPDYFFNDLASNPNTPIVILEDIYKQKHKNSGIAQNLVKNPVTPKIILEKLSSETEVRVFHAFVKRLDSRCDFLDEMKERINPKQKTYGVYKFAMSDYKRKCIKK